MTTVSGLFTCDHLPPVVSRSSLAGHVDTSSRGQGICPARGWHSAGGCCGLAHLVVGCKRDPDWPNSVWYCKDHWQTFYFSVLTSTVKKTEIKWTERGNKFIRTTINLYPKPYLTHTATMHNLCDAQTIDDRKMFTCSSARPSPERALAIFDRNADARSVCGI